MFVLLLKLLCLCSKICFLVPTEILLGSTACRRSCLVASGSLGCAGAGAGALKKAEETREEVWRQAAGWERGWGF